MAEVPIRPIPTVDDFVVSVQTIPGRERALRETLQSLAESDFSGTPIVVMQRKSQTKQRNLIESLHVLMESGKTYGIRFEDDVIVNRHLIHNLVTWAAFGEIDFGLGWLWHSFLLAKMRTNVSVNGNGLLVRQSPDIVGSQGVVVETVRIPHLVNGLVRCWDVVGGAQDKSMSRAMWRRGLRIYLHDPQLVEHNVKHESTLAASREVNLELHTTNGIFDCNWRRATT